MAKRRSGNPGPDMLCRGRQPCKEKWGIQQEKVGAGIFLITRECWLLPASP